MEDLRSDPSDENAIDCIFGIFISPTRHDPERLKAFGFTHLVSLVGVTRKDSRIQSITDVMLDEDIEVYCVRGEVGQEYATKIIDVQPHRSPRLNEASYDRIENVLTSFNDPKTTHRDRIAFIDAVSAHRYVTTRQDSTPETDRVEIRLRQLMWYASGVFVRRQRDGRQLGEEFWKLCRRRIREARMDLWDSGKEADMLQDLYFKDDPARDLVRPILFAKRTK